VAIADGIAANQIRESYGIDHFWMRSYAAPSAGGSRRTRQI
jgi:hypothetical protein